MTISDHLFQASPVPMWVYDTQTFSFLLANTAAVNSYGYTAEEFRSLNVDAIQPESHQDENGIRHIKKNGEIIYVKVETNKITFHQQEAMLVIAMDITQGITERIRNEVEMKLTVEKFNIISKATSDAIWDWNLVTDKIVWNKGINGIFGYKNLYDNMTSGEWRIMQIHLEDRERVMSNLHSHIRDKIARWKDEYRFKCADGSYKYVLDRGFMVFDESGRSVRIIGSMQDISQRKQEEQWSRLLESVVINASDAVLICTGNGEGSGQTIIYVNEAYTKMSGYTKYELIGCSPGIAQGLETDQSEIKKLQRAIQHKQTCQLEVINYTKEGKAYWVSQSHAPIADANGVVTHWISIQRDISQHKKYLTEIEEQNKKFKEIAWIQSHSVRAPLARVMGLVDLLKNFEPGDETDELLMHLESSAKELDSIIIDIADKTPKSSFL